MVPYDTKTIMTIKNNLYETMSSLYYLQIVVAYTLCNRTVLLPNYSVILAFDLSCDKNDIVYLSRFSKHTQAYDMHYIFFSYDFHVYISLLDFRYQPWQQSLVLGT